MYQGQNIWAMILHQLWYYLKIERPLYFKYIHDSNLHLLFSLSVFVFVFVIFFVFIFVKVFVFEIVCIWHLFFSFSCICICDGFCICIWHLFFSLSVFGWVTSSLTSRLCPVTPPFLLLSPTTSLPRILSRICTQCFFFRDSFVESCVTASIIDIEYLRLRFS